MSRFVALLRGINVGGKNTIPMADLRSLCYEIGWNDAETYIQSGNITFTAKGKAAVHELALEVAIEGRFGLSVPVIVRSRVQWRRLTDDNPFPKESETEPNRVMVALSKSAPRRNAAAELRARAVNGEHIEAGHNVLWFHFPDGQARTKLSPALMDRLVGSSVTLRNWRTIVKLNGLLDA